MSKRSAKKKETALVPEVVEPVLSRRHEAVMLALLSKPTINEVAEAAGVSEATVFRLMKREDFQAALAEARGKVFDGALSTLQAASVEAVSTLQKNLTCGTPAAENQAAQTLLSFSLKVREQFGLEARLKQLEQTIKAYQEAEARRLAGVDEEEDET